MNNGMKRDWLSLFLGALCMLLVACSDDPMEPDSSPDPSPDPDPTEEWTDGFRYG